MKLPRLKTSIFAVFGIGVAGVLLALLVPGIAGRLPFLAPTEVIAPAGSPEDAKVPAPIPPLPPRPTRPVPRPPPRASLPAAIPPRLARIPELQGKRVSVAMQLLRLADLQSTTGVFYIAPENWRDDLLEGTVAMQTPQPGTVVESGTVVACWTFAPADEKQKTLAMPDLRGTSLADARGKLMQLNLRPMVPPAGKESREVLDHYPRPAQPVIEGSAVFLQLR